MPTRLFVHFLTRSTWVSPLEVGIGLASLLLLFTPSHLTEASNYFFVFVWE